MLIFSRKVLLPWTYVCSFPMSFIRLHRLSVLWKNWMFNQEPEHVFQVENSKDNEENILQREVPLRQSRRRYRKINQRGERQTITDNVDSNSYMSVSLLSLGPSPWRCDVCMAGWNFLLVTNLVKWNSPCLLFLRMLLSCEGVVKWFGLEHHRWKWR